MPDDAMDGALFAEGVEDSTRRQILDELAERPGVSKRRLCDRLDTFMRQLEFHLSTLEEDGHVVTVPGEREGEVLVFRSEDIEQWENERIRVLYDQLVPRRVGLYLADHPGAGVQEIVEALGLSQPTVLHLLRTLRSHSLVARLEVGRRREYHPSNELRAWARTVGEDLPLGDRAGRRTDA